MFDRREAGEGIKEALPVVLGYMPLGIAFGVLANQTGLSVAEATLMSALCFTGAGQYIAIGLLAAGGSWVTIILANLLVNVRYFLFSTSLVPYLRSIRPGIASLLMLGLTDETYAVSIVHYRNKEATSPYILGLNLTSYASWVGSTLLGSSLGHIITNTDKLGLNFALPAMYAILLVLVVNDRQHLIVALVAIVGCLILASFFPQTLNNLSNIIIAALIAASVGVMIKK